MTRTCNQLRLSVLWLEMWSAQETFQCDSAVKWKWLESEFALKTAKTGSTFHFLILYFVKVSQQYKSWIAASKADPYYGHENIAHLCTQFIMHLFACYKYPPTW